MSVTDWGIFVVLTAAMVGVTWWSRRFSKDVSSFLVAGRKLRVWLGLCTGNVSGFGIITLAYLGPEGFRSGFSLMWITAMGFLITGIAFGVFGFGIQRFRATKAMTAGQFMEQRYSKGIRLVVGFIMAASGIINMAAFPIIGSDFLLSFVGLNEVYQVAGITVSASSILAMFLLIIGIGVAVICGQVGVLVSEYLQGVIIVVGMFTILFLAFRQVGVFQVRENLMTRIGPSAFNPFLKGDYGLIWALWYFIMQLLAPFASGPQIAKYASCDNIQVVRRLLLVSSIFGTGKQLVMLGMGVATFLAVGAVNAAGMDAHLFERVTIARYISSICPGIIKGIFFSAMVFAFVVTCSTYVITWASIIVNDLILPFKKDFIAPEKHRLMTRITMVLIGVFVYVWGVLFMKNLGTSVLNYLMLTGMMTYGGAIALLAGLYYSKANKAGAYGAIALCSISPIADLVMRKMELSFYKLNPQYMAVLAIALACLWIYVCSLRSGQHKKWVDYGKTVEQSEHHQPVMAEAQ